MMGSGISVSILRVWAVATLVTALPWFAGCAQTPAASDAKMTNDVMTVSDESDGRRRAKIRLELATGYFSNGQTTVALDELKQAIATDPTYFDAYNLRGLVYQRLNNPQLAEESYRKALALNPTAAGVQHNYGVLLCQLGRANEGLQLFKAAITNVNYLDKAKTHMAQAGCELSVGRRDAAEASYLRSYELDAGNPITAYNLSKLLYERGELLKAQFYIRRLNNSAMANSESLWLGIKVEQKLGNPEAVGQLASQLRKRFPQSKELAWFEKGTFNE
jgi:type IV pilus assembly protein PilF